MIHKSQVPKILLLISNPILSHLVFFPLLPLQHLCFSSSLMHCIFRFKNHWSLTVSPVLFSFFFKIVCTFKTLNSNTVTFSEQFSDSRLNSNYTSDIQYIWDGPQRGQDHTLLCHQQTSPAIAAVFCFFFMSTQLTLSVSPVVAYIFHQSQRFGPHHMKSAYC